MRRFFYLFPLAALLSACASPYGIPPYAGQQANSSALAALGAKNVALGSFDDAPFDKSCRGLQTLALPDGLTPAQYVRKALELELRDAKAEAKAEPDVTLTGKLEEVSFSSSAAITMGHWTLGLTLRSSNGKQLKVSEHFEFDSGFYYVEACTNVAAAFPKAVRNLIGNAVSSPEFPGLLIKNNR